MFRSPPRRELVRSCCILGGAFLGVSLICLWHTGTALAASYPDRPYRYQTQHRPVYKMYRQENARRARRPFQAQALQRPAYHQPAKTIPSQPSVQVAVPPQGMVARPAPAVPFVSPATAYVQPPPPATNAQSLPPPLKRKPILQPRRVTVPPVYEAPAVPSMTQAAFRQPPTPPSTQAKPTYQVADNHPWPPMVPALSKRRKPGNVYITNGYRSDNLNWNIPGAVPLSDNTWRPVNILSELKWTDIKSYQIKTGGEYTVPRGMARGVHLEGSVYRGWIVSGDNQDSDYGMDDRNLEFSRSNNDAGVGGVKGISGALGYELKTDVSHDAYVSATPLVGYSIDKQNLKMRDGYQSIPFSDSETGEPLLDDSGQIAFPVGPFPGLHASYDSKWRGFFLGLKLGGEFGSHRLKLRSEYHTANYDAEADWNLREAFAHPKSFEHKADAVGYVFGLDYGYALDDALELTLGASYQDWQTESGVDRVFFADDTYSEGRLNEVNWDSQWYHAGLAYRW